MILHDLVCLPLHSPPAVTGQCKRAMGDFLKRQEKFSSCLPKVLPTPRGHQKRTRKALTMTLQGPQQHWLEKTRRIERAWGKETFLPGTSHSSSAQLPFFKGHFFLHCRLRSLLVSFLLFTSCMRWSAFKSNAHFLFLKHSNDNLKMFDIQSPTFMLCHVLLSTR